MFRVFAFFTELDLNTGSLAIVFLLFRMTHDATWEGYVKYRQKKYILITIYKSLYTNYIRPYKQACFSHMSPRNYSKLDPHITYSIFKSYKLS